MRKDIFGIPIQYEVWDKQGSLPLHIAVSYDFYGMFIGSKRCVVIRPKEELASLPVLRKQLAKIQEIDHAPIILEISALSFYRKKSLIENNISFITSKQAFLPFIGTMLTNENEMKTEMDRFVFSTQQLFLLYLYSGQKKFYVSAAAKILPVTAMTLTRAVRQLEAADLFNVTKDGVNKVIEAKYTRTELFGKAKAFLLNPVRKWGYIDKNEVTSDMVFAGETALSEQTMLNPSRLITYAIWDKGMNREKLTDELIDPETQVKLEMWAYDPKLFSKEKTADPLSVALSFENNHDERLEEAVEEWIGRVFENDEWVYEIPGKL